MDRTLRSALLRPRHLLATLAVVVLAGGGLAVAAAAGSASDLPEAAQVPFGVPLPRAGDHGAYVLTGVGEDGQGENGDGYYPARLEFEWLADGEGYNAAGARVVVNRLLVREEHPSREPRQELLHLLPGTTTVVFQREETLRQEGPSQFPFAGNTSHDTRMRSWIFFEADTSLWCGLRNVLQGAAVPLDRPVPDTATCFNGPGSWAVEDYVLVGTGVAGSAPERTAAFGTHMAGDPQPVDEWVFHEQVPYPVHIRFLSGSTATYRLASFERGDQPIAMAQTVLSPAPAPLALAARQVWGPDEAGVRHPFPLSMAFAQARDAPGYPDLRGFLASHPRAYVARAGYQEMTFNGQLHRGWTLVATDGSASLGVYMDTVWADVLGRQVQLRAHYQAADGWAEGATFLPPEAVMAQLPTVAGVMATWAALSGRPAADANEWGFDLACNAPLVAECPGLAQVYAGRMEDQSTSVPPQRTSSHSRVVSNALGRPQAYFTQDYEQRLAFSPIGAPPATPEAPDFSTLSEVVPPWTLTAEAAAAAGAGALLVGLAYFLWPVAKAGGVGLFSRVRTDRLLDNPVRATLHQAVEAQPGIHQQDLVRLVGKGNGTIEHHLRKLVQGGLVVRVAGQGYTCYFLKGAVGRQAMAAAPILKSHVAQAVLDAARNRPGLAPSALARELGVSAPTISYHLRRLEAAGLVRMEDGLRAAA